VCEALGASVFLLYAGAEDELMGWRAARGVCSGRMANQSSSNESHPTL
jgi:hypothetical protein